MFRDTVEDFLEKARNKHGNRYDYSLVTEYTRNTDKVNILCDIHGVFSQTPSSHLGGTGCPVCGDIKARLKQKISTEDFVSKATSLHGNKYSYAETDCIASKLKVKINCGIHGQFLQTPDCHLSGQGCPKCQRCGYNKGKPGTFYILTANNLTKVGITNRDVKLRVKPISKGSGEDFKINSSLFFEDGAIAANLELSVLHWLQETHKPVDRVFDGSTECFLDVDLPTLLNKVIQVLNVSPN